MRKITKPSTAKCDKDLYTWFLLAESKYSGCTRLAEILSGISHDSVNRFLLRERYCPKDLFNEVKLYINLIGGTLSADDTVIEKPYSDPDYNKFIGYFWSGNEHRPIKGINLVTLYYTDPTEKSVPINYRLDNKKDEKTKNDYFREMVAEVLTWGLRPDWVTGDCWYSSRDNLKFLKNQKLGFLMGIAKNRQVSLVKGQYTQVSQLDIPPDGLVVYLKQYGWVKVFRKTFKNEVKRYYIMWLSELPQIEQITRRDFIELHLVHWGIECYHRAIKQLCGIKRFLVRTPAAILTHFFCSIRAFTQLELMRAESLIENWYQPQRNLSIQVARDFILEHLNKKVGLSTNT
ncbi:MAG: transposase [Xenococcaceae cyanobacterium]